MITVLFIVLSFFSVSQAMKSIPIGTAYAVWAGIGAAGTVICGILFFGDSAHIIRLLSIILIIIGIIGLKLVHVEMIMKKKWGLLCLLFTFFCFSHHHIFHRFSRSTHFKSDIDRTSSVERDGVESASRPFTKKNTPLL